MADRRRCQASALPHLAEALKDFLHQVGAVKPILVGHSIGGMIVQQLLVHDPIIAEYVVLAQTSPAFGQPDGDWQKEFLDARLGPLDRGETMASLAPRVVADLVGDERRSGRHRTRLRVHGVGAGGELPCRDDVDAWF